MLPNIYLSRYNEIVKTIKGLEVSYGNWCRVHDYIQHPRDRRSVQELCSYLCGQDLQLILSGKNKTKTRILEEELESLDIIMKLGFKEFPSIPVKPEYDEISGGPLFYPITIMDCRHLVLAKNIKFSYYPQRSKYSKIIRNNEDIDIKNFLRL